VLLHGFAASTQANWVAPGIWKTLVDAGHQVTGPDARGHGHSDKPHDPSAYDNGAMVRDVGALLDHLGLVRPDVAGYSMGAGTALRFALTDGRVRRLVLGGIGGDLASRVLGQTGRVPPAWRGRAQRIAAALEAEDPAAIEDPAVRRFRRFADSQGADLRALGAIQRSNRYRLSGAAPDLSALKAPTW